MSKKIEDLNNKEIFEDIEYYLNYAQVQPPPFVDKTFEIIRGYINELKLREAIEKKKITEEVKKDNE